jgi:hypothetical protein
MDPSDETPSDATPPDGEGPGPSPGDPRTTNLGVIAGGVILIGLVAFAFHRMRSQPHPPGEPVAGSESAAPGATPAAPLAGTPITAKVPFHLSPEASILAEHYQCVCGCTDLLSVCTCDKPRGSNEMKAFLQDQVNQKRSAKEIDAAMIARFGDTVLAGAPKPAPTRKP